MVSPDGPSQDMGERQKLNKAISIEEEAARLTIEVRFYMLISIGTIAKCAPMLMSIAASTCLISMAKKISLPSDTICCVSSL